MTPDDAFLQAILEQPDDDTPRLMYADWLEERGNPRGEFIRIQCELARISDGHPHRVPWEAAAARLLAWHREEWLGPLRSLAYWWKFSRGFPEEVAIGADGFLTHAAQFFQRTPLRVARLLRAGSLMGELARSSALLKLSALHLTDNGIGDDGVERLASSRHVLHLTTLRLGNNHIGDRGVLALAESRHLEQLRVLNLERNYIGNEGARALANSPHLAGLTALHLGDNLIGPAGVEALLASSHLDNLEQLELANSSPPASGGNRVSPLHRLKLRERFPAAALTC